MDPFLENLPDGRLLPTHKNELVQATLRAGFGADEFEWSEGAMFQRHLDYTNSEGCTSPVYDKQYRISIITHKASRFFCKFGPISLEYSPGSKIRVENERIGESGRLGRPVIVLSPSHSCNNLNVTGQGRMQPRSIVAALEQVQQNMVA